MSLDLIPYDLPLRSPMATSHAIVADRRGALVRLDDHGTIGWGDLCPMPGWSVQEFESLHDQVDMAGLRLDEDMIGDVLDTLVGAPEARAALAGAAADVLAKKPDCRSQHISHPNRSNGLRSTPPSVPPTSPRR